MHKLTLILSLIFFFLPASAENSFKIMPIKKIEANPIYIAFMLSQETDSAKMASICDYYGYESQPTLNGYTVFRHKNGSIIRYSFNETTEAQPHPTVEVKSNRGSSASGNALANLNFKKKGSGYILNVGQHARSETSCNPTNQGFLVFHKTQIPQQK